MRILTPWTSQPQVPVDIDWSNPITRGLVNAANIQGGTPAYNLVLGKSAPTGGTLTPSAFAGGYGKKFASAAIQFPRSVYTGAETMLSVCRPTTVDANWRAIMHRRNTTTIGTAQSGATMWILGYDNSVGLQLTAWQSSGASCVAINSGSANIAANETFVAVGVVPGNGLTAALYKNGNLVNSATQSAAMVDAVVTTEVGGMHANNTSRYFLGDQSLALHWNRALSDAEIRSISANQWQIFRPIPRRIFVPVSAGGSDVTGTANITETGETVSSSGAVLVGGTSSTTNSAQTVSSSGTVAISGSASVTETAETLSASGDVVSGVVGTASITETAETVTASGSIAIGGTASISPSAQTVVSSGTIAITGTTNVYELAETLTASGIALGGVTGLADLTQAAQTLSAFATSAFPTIGRPDADVSNTGWTPSSGSDLYAMLDEVTPDDADYISTNSVGAVCSIGLNATQYPGSASQQLSLRASSSTGNGLTVVIKDGATTIATRSLTLTPTYELHTITLTSGEIAAITTGNLTVEMTST